MNTQICIPVNEINCIEIPEFQLYDFIHQYASEYGFLWWHNDRNVFKYWLAHEITRKGRVQKRIRVSLKDFDLTKNSGPCIDHFLIRRLSEN